MCDCSECREQRESRVARAAKRFVMNRALDALLPGCGVIAGVIQKAQDANDVLETLQDISGS